MSIRERFRYAAGHVNYRKNVKEIAFPKYPDVEKKFWPLIKHTLWHEPIWSARMHVGVFTMAALGTWETVKFVNKFFEKQKDLGPVF